MKRILILACLMFFALAVLAQAPKETKKAPPITEVLAKNFWKAQSEFQSAQVAAEKANQAVQQKQTKLQSAIDDLKSACGNDFQLQADTNNNLICAAKPELSKPEKK